jgi:hypothetical protein
VRAPKALGGEQDLGHWLATHATDVHGRYPIEGRLWVTPTRLVFVPPPVFRLVRRFHWSCNLTEIERLEIRPVEPWRLNRSPRQRIAIVTDGRTHFFVARDPDAVREAIGDAIAGT